MGPDLIQWLSHAKARVPFSTPPLLNYAASDMYYKCTCGSHSLLLTVTLTFFTPAYLVVAGDSLFLQMCQHFNRVTFTRIGTASELLSLMLLFKPPCLQILGETAWLKPTWGIITSYSYLYARHCAMYLMFSCPFESSEQPPGPGPGPVVIHIV